jgi:CO/xanthine dehydrogenase FAD-binding subunit
MFTKPRSLKEACEALALDGALPLAGGTDLFPAWVDRPQPERLVDLRSIAEMRGISVAPDLIRIGGGTTWSEIIAANLPPCFDCLKAAAREVGSVQIQNAGTLAGNLCNASPAADGVPPLLVLDAEVELASSSGMRRLPLGNFILGNRRTERRHDEILSAIIVPRRHDGARSAFLKLGARRYLVISIVMVAAAIERDRSGRIVHAAIAVGSASETARRMASLEAKLLAAEPARAAASLVEEGDLALSPIDDLRASAAYRSDAALTLVRRALAEVDGEGNA